MVDEFEKEILLCSEQYQQIAKEFMNSYGLEDYLTKFNEGLRRLSKEHKKG